MSPDGRLRCIGWASVLTGLATLLCVAAGWDANDAAAAWLFVGGFMTTAFGAFGLGHLKLVRNGNRTARPRVFLAYYWVPSVVAPVIAVLAAIAGPGGWVYAAETLQVFSVLLLIGWFASAAARHG